MNRKEFIQKGLTLGASISFLPYMLSSCKEEFITKNNLEVNFSGKVLIIGAGAAGLTAAHILNQYGIDFELIEASNRVGGRVMKIDGFADFPIDLGAEWIHTDPSIFSEIINDPAQNDALDIIVYNPQTVYAWKNNKLRRRNIYSNFYSEYKFKDSTWFDFFEDYIVPGVIDRIRFNEQVNTIDYSGDEVVVTTGGNQYTGDRVIATVPLTVLKNDIIQFNPPLPQEKIKALNGVDMPDGIKIFVEFRERFYPDILFDGGLIENLVGGEEGEKAIYDAAFGKDSSRNVLALFTVGKPATAYTSLETDEAIINYLMEELDRIFEGKASQHYMNHVIQNWSQEPFINGSYAHYTDYSVKETLFRPVNQKLFFAGEAYHDDAQSTVHGASLTAYSVVEEILKNA